jgi:hypothetical protein
LNSLKGVKGLRIADVALQIVVVPSAIYRQQNQFLPRAAFSEETYQSRSELRVRVHRIITTYLKKSRQNHQTRPGKRRGNGRLRSATVSMMFPGLIQPAAIIWDLSEGRFDVNKHIEKAWEIFSRAIKTQKPVAFLSQTIKPGPISNMP